jgi:hypothetical protein
LLAVGGAVPLCRWRRVVMAVKRKHDFQTQDREDVIGVLVVMRIPEREAALSAIRTCGTCGRLYTGATDVCWSCACRLAQRPAAKQVEVPHPESRAERRAAKRERKSMVEKNKSFPPATTDRLAPPAPKARNSSSNMKRCAREQRAVGERVANANRFGDWVHPWQPTSYSLSTGQEKGQVRRVPNLHRADIVPANDGTVCPLCGRRVPRGEMLTHKEREHGEARVAPSPAQGTHGVRVSMVSGGLPSLGKNSR